MSTAEMVHESFTVHRPEGLSDSRWAVMCDQVQRVTTGHFSWCNDHASEAGEDHCRREERCFCATAVLNTSSQNGRVEIALYIDDNEDQLSPAQALAIGSMLYGVAKLAHAGGDDLVRPTEAGGPS